MIEEIWKHIKNFEIYEISNTGKIRRNGRYLKPSDCGGELCVGLSWNGKQVDKSVHILVAEAFLSPQPPDKFYVCHKDGCYKNNHISNLRWGSPKENSFDKKIHGTENWGEANPFSKLTEQDIIKIRTDFKNGIPSEKIAKNYPQVCSGHIAQVLKYENWKYY